MAGAPIIDLSQPLATLLREGTKQAHTDAETSQGAKLLLGGKLPKDEYVRFLMTLWYVYDAIERALDRHAAYPTLEPTYNPTLLARAPALAADISYLLDVPADKWQSHPMHKDLCTPSLPSSLQAYVSRLDALADSADPSPLLAHSYVRYLGDLSGGQSIKRIIAKAYGLDAGLAGAGELDGGSESGVSFYIFKELRSAGPASIGEMKRIKDWFRDGMNVAGERCASGEAKLAIVEEASNAFRLNMGLFSSIRNEPAATNKGGGGRKQSGTEASWPLASVAAFIAAACLAHFIIVVGGFTGNRGYEKLLAIDEWVREAFQQFSTGSA
ncbi:heme oxygenase 1 [Ephemerocybe angulata]|uniref:Heme oxygenase 1 n=1 Tax=Ephemerocybe angulata TaxID=980116 RepID=A0A8H6M4X1_9AGAR|nr:heme oxygenase 1 [Tulosesus angulatus]